MSYCRFSEGDVYVFATAGRGGWSCCSCQLDLVAWFAKRSEMIAHLEEHEAAGHDTGEAIPMLRRELAEAGETEFRPGHGIG